MCASTFTVTAVKRAWVLVVAAITGDGLERRTRAATLLFVKENDLMLTLVRCSTYVHCAAVAVGAIAILCTLWTTRSLSLLLGAEKHTTEFTNAGVADVKTVRKSKRLVKDDARVKERVSGTLTTLVPETLINNTATGVVATLTRSKASCATFVRPWVALLTEVSTAAVLTFATLVALLAVGTGGLAFTTLVALLTVGTGGLAFTIHVALLTVVTGVFAFATFVALLTVGTGVLAFATFVALLTVNAGGDTLAKRDVQDFAA
jgi:hypothetical protein